MNRNGILETAVHTWGEKAQIACMIEECAELIHALCKYNRERPNAVDAVQEEIADVQIMLDQMKLIFDNQAIQAWDQKKIKRISARLLDQ